MAVAIAGPAINIISAIIISSLPEFREKLPMVYTNLLIAIFNLIPMYPLDGGRALEAVFMCFFSNNEVAEIVHKVSNVSLLAFTIVGIIGAVYLKNIAIIAILIYLWAIMLVENKRHKLKTRVYRILELNREKK